jgi:hypothetical protein
MLVSADHRPWALATLALSAAATALYCWSVSASPYGPSGGSWPGLFFGITGTACMTLAALLSARKPMRVRRIGSAQTWMKMHIWLGLLAVPFIWFHSGFALGGPLTTTIMALFYLVTASGLVGLVLQQFVPALMTARVPLETIHSQIDHVAAGLAADAYEAVASVAGAMPEAREEQEWLAAEEQRQKSRASDWKLILRQRPAAAPAPGAAALREFYLAQIRPYLLAPHQAAPPDFAALRIEAAPEWQPQLERLRQICAERAQLVMQQRLHALLHNWLFLHAPLSLALFLLVAVHIVVALRY